ncbi:MAG TPA: DUF6036 family nucleotidyltransferase [Acidimicrobiales bacterium]|nr:DUF6036 family nucleotidyltransferase [Acidimicrobiales bacterium]
MSLLDRNDLLQALRALDEELGRVGVRGEVFVVGGAAMALAYDARRATVDVDAVFAPSAEVREAARRVAERLGFEPGWLNDAAKAFVPGEDPERIGVYEGTHLSVAAGSPRLLLAMKLLAARVERDQDDIRTLYGLCGFTTAAEGIELVTEAYPEARIAPRTRFLLEELFPSHGLDRGDQPARHRDDRGLGR